MSGLTLEIPLRVMFFCGLVNLCVLVLPENGIYATHMLWWIDNLIAAQVTSHVFVMTQAALSSLQFAGHVNVI